MIYEKINLYDYFKKDQRSEKGVLSVYAPDNSAEICSERKHPAMLVLPGGGYIGNSFREAEPIALEFLSRGFTSFVLSYDLYPFAYSFSPLTEGAMAMKFIRENAEKYNVDPSKVCVCGFSAGGHLASFLATAFDDDIFSEYFDGDIQNIRPDGAVLCYPVISKNYVTNSKTVYRIVSDRLELLDKISTDLRVNEDTSPSYIWTTLDDDCVNSIHSVLFAKACAEHNVPFSIHVFPKGQHGLSLADSRVYNTQTKYRTSKRVGTWVDEACDFLEENGIAVNDIPNAD